MPLRRHRHFHKPGGPEFGAVLLIAFTLAGAFLWWRNEDKLDWPKTQGSVLSCEILNMHYNATKYGNRVEIRYEYEVGDRPYIGHWIGYWPVIESPNALAAEQMEVLKTRGYPLVVMYNRDNPSISRLHDISSGRRRLLGGATIIAAAASFVYMCVLYPRLRRQ